MAEGAVLALMLIFGMGIGWVGFLMFGGSEWQMGIFLMFIGAMMFLIPLFALSEAV